MPQSVFEEQRARICRSCARLHGLIARSDADVTDIGDTSYSAVLVDDLDNDGQLELLVTTMSGHLYSFGSPGEYQPLKTWPQGVPGNAVFTARHDYVRRRP